MELKIEKQNHFTLNERNLAVLVNSLLSAWMLAFLFEGRIFYALAEVYQINPTGMVFGSVAAIFAGLLFCGLYIRTKRAAKRLFLYSNLYFIVVSAVFFFPPSVFWTIGMFTCSFIVGNCVAAWGFFLKSGVAKNERMKMIADMLILSNLLMILLDTAAVYLSPQIAMALSMFLLLCASGFTLKLPSEETIPQIPPVKTGNSAGLAKPLVILCLFIAIITIDSGLMYQVVTPAFTHLEGLTSWYWAVPYILALFVMRNLPRRISRTYILYAAIAMLGLSFIGYMALDRSAVSYFIINTLMLGAFGICDLFWWSILGEMLEFHQNPATILGTGLAANVLGVLLGGLIGSAVMSADLSSQNSILLALAVVCVTLALLPLLHKHLSALLKNHIYLSTFSDMSAQQRTDRITYTAAFGNLSERENQVTSLLIEGKTYRAIADELYISENTVKYYVKNIYAKLEVKSRAELMTLILDKTGAASSE